MNHRNHFFKFWFIVFECLLLWTRPLLFIAVATVVCSYIWSVVSEQVRNFTKIFEMQRLHPTGFREIYVFPTRKDRSFNFQERITTLSTLISTQVIWFSYLCSCPFFNSVPGFLVKLFIGRYQKGLFLIKSTIEVN